MFFGKSQVQPIGIDIGHDAVRMIQVEVSGGVPAVRAACGEEFGPEVRAQPQLRMPMAVDLVRRMLRKGGFTGRRAVAALPREIVHIKSVRLPQMPATESEAAARFEARQLFGFETDIAQVQVIPAGEVRQGADVLQEAIVVAARTEDINNFVEQLHRSGVVLESLDLEPCALFRSVERFIRRREDEQEVHVLVDVGLVGTQVLIGKGREMSFLKMIELGGQHLTEAVARKLGIAPDEARALRRRLAGRESEPQEKRDPVRQAVLDAVRGVLEQLGREIALCLRYQSVTFRGHRPTRLRLFGGEINDPYVVEALKSAIPVPVEAGRPLFNLETGRIESLGGQGSEWAVALGLALRHTAGRFAARDGRPRGAVVTEAVDPEPIAPDAEPAGAGPARQEALHA